jgi:two-component system, NtrC family, nitrogen regulation response regulator GlnG
MSKILVVDDEQSICWGIEKLGKSLGYQVFVASSAEQGLRLAAECRPDLLILDVRLPGMDGLTAMEQFRRHLGSAPMVIITAFGDLETAIKAVQNGAFEYVLKPFDLEEIRGTIRRALCVTQLTDTTEVTEPVGGMLGKTPIMQEVFKKIALAAAAEVPVLLEGESGVGKASAARAIHWHSSRASKPFVTANLAAVGQVLAEEELFGSPSTAGLLVEANGGTLFLEDVAEIPVPVQVKLSRVIEQGEFVSAGHDESIKIDVRLISSTTASLSKKVQAGEFRGELFYQLGGFEIKLPPLRMRLADIPVLARHFAAQRRSTVVNFAEETIKELISRPWYGNVRELRSAIEHALVVARVGLIMPEHLPTALPALSVESTSGADSLEEFAKRRAVDLLSDPQADGFVYEKFLEEVEPALLESAMDRFSHECAPAARALGLHRTTLKRKLDQYGIAK